MESFSSLLKSQNMRLISVFTLGFVICGCANAKSWGKPSSQSPSSIIPGHIPPPHHRPPIYGSHSAQIDCTNARNQLTLHPHPIKCTIYLQCVHGQPIERPCTPGTEFSSIYGVCVHSWQSGCTPGPIPEGSGEEVEGDPETPVPEIPDDSAPEAPEEDEIESSGEAPKEDEVESSGEAPKEDEVESSGDDAPEIPENIATGVPDEQETETPDIPDDVAPEASGEEPIESSGDVEPDIPDDLGTTRYPEETEEATTDLIEEPEERANPYSICASEPSRIFVTADPTDCANYVICSIGSALVRSCGDGDYFDARVAQCVPGPCRAEYNN